MEQEASFARRRGVWQLFNAMGVRRSAHDGPEVGSQARIDPVFIRIAEGPNARKKHWRRDRNEELLREPITIRGFFANRPRLDWQKIG
jgi:hypothetical protein